MEPPVADRRPVILVHFGDDRPDPYFWLRDAEDPAVTAYLEAENAYTQAALAHTVTRQQRLYDEIVGRVQEDDTSAPVPFGGYEYFHRTFAGRQYPSHCRRRLEAGGASPAGEEVIIDENALAAGHEYFHLTNLDVSPDHSLAAYAVDTAGAERFTMKVRDLTTGTDLDDVIDDVYYGVAWAADNRTLFYARPDASMRPWQVWRHHLGRPTVDDVLVFQEDDARFFVSVGATRSRALIVIDSSSRLTSEAWVLPAGDPTAALRVVEPRQQGVEYSVEHHGPSDMLFIVTNADGAEDFKVMAAPASAPGRAGWTEVLPHRPGIKVDNVDAFTRHLVVTERAEGLDQLRVLGLLDAGQHVIEHPEPVYTAYLHANPEADTDELRFEYTSMVTPPTVFRYDMDTRARQVVKQQPVLGDFDASRYATERVWATAPDGTQVPVSLVHRRDVARDGSAPALLYGYGSYEHSISPAFSSARISLVDRGFVFAIAHVRGGGELGRRWYDQGKLLHKRNTFTDFIACAEHLVAQGWTTPERLVARGASAGGLLMGAVANLRPDLFKAIVAEVPFVDALTTILDKTLPLTVTEWEEWGNPVADRQVYNYMKGYAPYDNVEAKAYPAMLVTAGLNDPRVSYWEPAKWVARLRATKTDDHLLLLKTDMGAGHGGPSGRYDAWKDEALVYAFVLDAVGDPEPEPAPEAVLAPLSVPDAPDRGARTEGRTRSYGRTALIRAAIVAAAVVAVVAALAITSSTSSTSRSGSSPGSRTGGTGAGAGGRSGTGARVSTTLGGGAAAGGTSIQGGVPGGSGDTTGAAPGGTETMRTTSPPSPTPVLVPPSTVPAK